MATSLMVAVLAVAAVAAACGHPDPGAGAAAERSSDQAVSTDPTSTQTSTQTSTLASSTTSGPAICGRPETSTDGRVARADLTEASGLAASRHHPGVLWTHNDSGGVAGVYALDRMGRDLGFFALVRAGHPVATADAEDLAIVDGTLYLADIGDNSRRRDTVAVHLFPEPDPTGGDDGDGDGTVEESGVIAIRYPDGPTDAEALLVDPLSGQLVILTKDSDDPAAATRIYTVDPPAPGSGQGTGGEQVEATLAGTVDMVALARSSTVGGFSPAALLFPGAVTGADISPGGDLVAVRTYGSVWLFDREPGQTVAQALQGRPCEGGATSEGQGEAVAILAPTGSGTDHTVEYVTIGEGQASPVNLVRIPLDH